MIGPDAAQAWTAEHRHEIGLLQREIALLSRLGVWPDGVTVPAHDWPPGMPKQPHPTAPATLLGLPMQLGTAWALVITTSPAR